MKNFMVAFCFGVLVTGCGDKAQPEDASAQKPEDSRTVISVEQGPAGPRFFSGSEEIDLSYVSYAVAKSGGREVLLRPAPNVGFALLQEVWSEIGVGGQSEVVFDASLPDGSDRPVEITIPFTTRPSPGAAIKVMPRFVVTIGDLGDVSINGGQIETGEDPEMKDLTAILKENREMRERMIKEGGVGQEEAELVVGIACTSLTEYRALASVFNACLAAGVKRFYPPDFGPYVPPQVAQKKKQVVLKQRQKKTQPSAESGVTTQAISDIQMPQFSNLHKPTSPTTDASKALSNIGLALPKTIQGPCGAKPASARLLANGGDQATDAAILRGLNWLKANQAQDGSWGANDKKRDGNLMQNDKNSMTGMALLCFLGHCELQDSPAYGESVRKGIAFLTSTPPDRFTGRDCYSHAIRTHALCEIYRMTKIKKLEAFARKATEAIIKGQNQSGGWAYGYSRGPTAHVDLSVTAWNVQALKAASLTGLAIDGLDAAMDNAAAYVKRCQDQSGKFGYKELQPNSAAGGKPSLTGAGVLSLLLWKNEHSEEVAMGLEWIIANLATEWAKVSPYEWYYHAYACSQSTGVSGAEKYWKAWNKDFQGIVLAAQAADGHWPIAAHFHGDTDMFRTTLTIRMLQVYYRYLSFGSRADIENKQGHQETQTKDIIREVSTDELVTLDGLMYVKEEEKPFTGTAITYYPDGSKKSEYPYVNGKKHGMAIWHNEDGSKRSEIFHMDGKKHGKWIGYRKDGSKYSESIWENGRKISAESF